MGKEGCSMKDIERNTGMGRKTVQYILNNPIYYGFRKLSKTETDYEDDLITKVSKITHWVKHTYPILIDKYVLEKCFVIFNIKERIKETNWSTN